VIRYFDASALAKRYASEPETAAIRRLLERSDPAASRLTHVEVASALCRRTREGALPASERDRALNALGGDFERFHVVELSVDIVVEAIRILRRHPLRAPDAIQVATCLYLQRMLGTPVELVGYDARLSAAARREGVPVRPG
jgi:hypothetical protein